MHRFLGESTDDYSILIRPKWGIDVSADDIIDDVLRTET